MNRQCYFIGTGWGEAAVALPFRELAFELSRRGHKVVLLVDGRRTDAEKHGANPGIWTWPSRRPTRLLDFVFLFRLMRGLKPDCMIANFGSVNVMTVMGWLMRVPSRVVWYHTLVRQIDLDSRKPGWHLRLLRLRKRGIYALASAVVAVSRAAKHDLTSVFKVPQRRVGVVWNALSDPGELSAAHADSPGDGNRTVVCAGRFDACKGQAVLIRAVAELRTRSSDFRVEFVGDGPLRGDCINLVAELGLAGRFEFLGRLPHNEVIERMARAYVSVVPSHDEAFGLVVIESMAVGTPVVGSNVGGIPEIIRDGVDGRLFRPGDSQDLADKLEQVLKDPNSRNRMGESARQRFVESFELRRSIAKQADWLEGFVEAKRSGSREPEFLDVQSG